MHWFWAGIRISGIELMSPDQLILEFDRALRTIFSHARSVRPIPGNACPDVELDAEQKRHVIGLMRINHCGEICAQALYQGQALTSRDPGIRDALKGPLMRKPSTWPGLSSGLPSLVGARAC